MRTLREIVERAVDGGTDIHKITDITDALGRVLDVSPDGATVLGASDRVLQFARVTGNPDERGPKELATAGAVVRQARFSPDGRWVVYSADGLYVQPFPGPGRRRQIAPDGSYPIWRRDLKEIAYIKLDMSLPFTSPSEVWSVPVTTAAGELVFGAPQRLFGGLRFAPGTNQGSRPLALLQDGSRFLIPKAIEQPDSGVIHVMMRR